MFDSAIGISGSNLEATRVRLQEGQLTAVRELLPDEAIWQACASARYTYRRRLLTPLVVVFHYLSAALWPEESFQAAAAFGGLDIPSGSLCKARQRLPRAVMDKVESYVAKVGQLLSESRAYYQGLRVVTIDGTCVSMDDTPELTAHFGRVNTKHGKSKYPEARMAVASLATTGVILSHRLGPYRTSEQALATKMLSSLRKGDLLVADSHFAGSNLYYDYLQHGLHFITPAHQRLKVERLTRIHEYPDGSFAAIMPVSQPQRKKYPYLPRAMVFRFVPVRLRSRRGNKITHLVTSLMKATEYPADEIREFYTMRWPVEITLRDLKHPLSADVLRSRTVEGVGKEVAAKVTALNLVRCLMLETADRHECDASRLSFAQCRRVAVAYSLKMSAAPVRTLPDLFEEMLTQMAFVVNPRRPGRVEPRAVRREFKHFQRLKTTRSEWRANYGLSA